ncbi:uncharacterized protein LOC142225758 [Haematobia irritans]|uniref:uncharacterized protein LOC142225758 n=1 Tax=Haematobia irritans TaxID=7368 RepID=UPI003F50D0DF
METKVNISALDQEQLHAMSMEEDVSLLRQPMRTALSGFLEAKKAHENGTDEVRRLLLYECSLLYECNVCRNIFRSLANFISHKRLYCKLSSERNYRPFSDNNSSLIIQTADKTYDSRFNKSRSTGSSPIPTKSQTRDLSKVIERLRKGDGSSQKISEQNQNSTASVKSDMHSDRSDIIENNEQCDPILYLESVPTSTQAVYQTLNPLNASDSIRTEVDEVHNLLSNQNTMLGPDGKAISSTPNLGISDTIISHTTLNDLEKINKLENMPLIHNQPMVSCDLCQMSFQTEKTLNIHIQKKHSSSTYVFQCPTCSLTFLQPAAVIRHLANEHKKPLKRIRKMRDSILRKRIQIGNVHVKGPSRELKGLQLDSAKDFETVQNGCEIDRQNDKPVSTCNFCQKTFDRRAAFATHLSNCPSKKTNLAKNEVQHNPRVAPKDENQTKLKNQKTPSVVKNLLENQNEKIKTNNQQQGINSQSHEKNQAHLMYDYESTTNRLYYEVNIKQEPPDEEFNSNSTQATNGSDINALFENLENQTFGQGLQTVSLDLMVSTHEQKQEEMRKDDKRDAINETIKDECTSTKDIIPESSSDKKVTKKLKGFRNTPASKQLTCRCKICNKQFNALSNLRRHISMFHYRARRFGCNLCEYRAFRRYDIVNHLSFVHKMQGERESMALEFVTTHDIQYSKDDVEHDIVVVNDAVDKTRIQKHSQLKTYDNKAKRKTIESKIDRSIQKSATSGMTDNDSKIKTCEHERKIIKAELDKERANRDGYKESREPSDVAKIDDNVLHRTKVVKTKLRKALVQEVAISQKRPIRNRIKTVNNDFVYDLSTLKEEPKDQLPKLSLKRRNTMGVLDMKNATATELIPPPIKITPYRLRADPLIPANKEIVKGYTARVYRNVVQEALAAPSTLPDLPAERPQMRPRLSLPCRNDSNSKPVIEATELEVARLESTFFDDSFLEKFAKKANPSFKMKPLLALQHSPLNSILQKFEINSSKQLSTEEIPSRSPPQHQNNNRNFSEACTTTTILNSDPTHNGTFQTLGEHILKQIDSSPPNGAHIVEASTPPSTPKKRITLMQRLADNRAKRRDPLLRSALEN